MNSEFKIAKSEIHGMGIFAAREIRKEELIFKFEGNNFELSEILTNKPFNLATDWNILQISNENYIYPFEPFIKINHSCKPNGIVKGDKLFAIREIGRASCRERV